MLDSISDDVLNATYHERPAKKKRDSLTDRKSSLSAYPYAYYTPETQLAFGAGGIYIFYTGDEKDLLPSQIGFGGYYTSNNQYKLSLSNAFYFFDNTLYFSVPVSYGLYVNKYWGVGDDTPERPNAAYAQRTFSTSLTAEIPLKFFTADRTGIIFDLDVTEIADRRDNELLQDETLPGYDGGSIFGIGGDLLWDSRDNIFFPNKGGYQYFKAIIYPNGMSDFNFASFEFDVRQYYSFSEDHVLAGNFYLQGVTGDTPFYKLPALGGQNRMRGYFNGRYRDNLYMMLQMEYRQYVYKRLGFVVFGGLGNVSDGILDFDMGNLKYSVGGGLRFLFNPKQKVNLRMDIGIGQEGNTGIYFGIQEAF